MHQCHSGTWKPGAKLESHRRSRRAARRNSSGTRSDSGVYQCHSGTGKPGAKLESHRRKEHELKNIVGLSKCGVDDDDNGGGGVHNRL